MAELVIKTHANEVYEKDDILCAFNDRRICCVHAQHICFERDPVTRRLTRLNGTGLLPPDDVARDYCRATYEFEFERLDAVTATITRLADENTIEFESNVPFIQHDGREVHMDIVAYMLRVTKLLRGKDARGKPLFGTQNGKEIWYGGTEDVSMSKMDIAWNAIETKTPLKRADFPFWPASQVELKHHLFLPVDQFDDTEAEVLVEEDIDDADPEQPIKRKSRKRHVPWESLVAREGHSVGHILDKKKAIDLRESRIGNPFIRSEIVKVKSSPQ